MKSYILIFLLSVIPLFSYAQEDLIITTPADTTLSATSNSGANFHDPDEDSYSPLLFFIFIATIVFIIVGVLTIVFIGLLILGLLAAGILSVSILVGYHQRSIEKGFKVFLISTTSAMGLIFGISLIWIFNKVVHWWTLQTALLIGSVSGLLGGVFIGFINSFIIGKLILFIKNRNNKKST